MAMSSSLTSISRRSLNGWFLIVVCFLTDGCSSPKVEYPAHITATHGKVTITHIKVAYDIQANLNDGLYFGDIIQTGSEASATITFQGGSELALGPDTRIVIQDKSQFKVDIGEIQTGSQPSPVIIGAIVLSGNAQAKTVKTTEKYDVQETPRLMIGTPFGLTEIGRTTSSTVHISTVTGFSVLVGNIDLIAPDGNKKTVLAGNSMTLDGLVIPIASVSGLSFTLKPKPPPPPVAPSLILRGDLAYLKIKPPSSDGKITAGTTITATQAAIITLDNESSILHMNPLTEITFESIERNAERSNNLSVSYALKGGITLFVKRSETLHRHRIRVGSEIAELSNEQDNSQVTFLNTSKQTRITTTQGQVTLRDKKAIDPGYRFEQTPGGSPNIVPIFQTHINAHPGEHIDVNYDMHVPKIAFDWSILQRTGPFTFTLINETTTRDVILSVKTNAETFRISPLAPGRYLWKVENSIGLVEGHIVLRQHAGGTGCKNCARTNRVSATGDQTVIYYQRTPPEITFTWPAHADATHYEFKLFRGDALSQPSRKEQTPIPEITIPSGILPEGTYYWLAVGSNASGQQVGTSPMNTLLLRHDNTLSELYIESPAVNTHIKTKTIISHGSVPNGTHLKINGKTVAIGASSGFSENIVLQKGHNSITYQTWRDEKQSTYQVRDIWQD